MKVPPRPQRQSFFLQKVPRRITSALLAGCAFMFVLQTTEERQLDHPFSFPKLWRRPGATESGWFAEGGHLRYDQQDGLRTQYVIPMDIVDRHQYVCDDEYPAGSSSGSSATQPMCVNNIMHASDLLRNLDAQAQIVASNATEPPSDVNEALQSSYYRLEGIRGRRLLVIGDSMDRLWLEMLVRKYGHLGTFRAHEYSGEEQTDEYWWRRVYIAKSVIIPLLPNAAAVRDYHDEVHLYVPKYNEARQQHPDTIRVDLIFVSGMLESNEIDFRLESTAPSSTRSRLEMSKAFWGGKAGEPSAYDMITVNFGLWDLLRLSVNNFASTGRDTFIGLESAWLSDWVKQGSEYLAVIRDLWGDRAQVCLRSTADVDFNFDMSYQPPNMPEGTPRDRTFTALRIQQLRAAQDELMRREGLLSLPFGHLLRGQTLSALCEDGVHPTEQGHLLYVELLLRRLKAMPRSRV